MSAWRPAFTFTPIAGDAGDAATDARIAADTYIANAQAETARAEAANRRNWFLIGGLIAFAVGHDVGRRRARK